MVRIHAQHSVFLSCLFAVAWDEAGGQLSSVTDTCSGTSTTSGETCTCSGGSSPFQNCHSCYVDASLAPVTCVNCRNANFLQRSIALPISSCFPSCDGFNWTLPVGLGQFGRRCVPFVDVNPLCEEPGVPLSPMSPWVGNRCHRRPTCNTDEFDVSFATAGVSPTFRSEKLCVLASQPCGFGEVEVAPLTATTDRVCEETTTSTTIATSTSITDTTITDTTFTSTSTSATTVPPCSFPSQYESQPLTPSTTRMCAPVTPPCSPAQFTAAFPTPTSDRDCRQRSKCSLGSTYQVSPPTATTDRNCTPVSPCVPQGYISRNATLLSDNECTSVSTLCAPEAPGTQYIADPASQYADVTCASVTTCNASAYAVAPATTTTDTTCQRLTTCPAYHPQSVAPTATSDRECGVPGFLAENQVSFSLETSPPGTPFEVTDLVNVITALQDWVIATQHLTLATFRVNVQITSSSIVEATIQYPAPTFVVSARDRCVADLTILTPMTVLTCIGESFLPEDSTTSTTLTSSTTTSSTTTITSSTTTSSTSTTTTQTTLTTTSRTVTTATETTATGTTQTTSTSSQTPTTQTSPTSSSTLSDTTTTTTTTTVSRTTTTISSTTVSVTSGTSTTVSSTTGTETTVTSTSITVSTITSSSVTSSTTTTESSTTTSTTSSTITTASTTTTTSSTITSSTASTVTTSTTTQITEPPSDVLPALASDSSSDAAATSGYIVGAIGLLLVIVAVLFLYRARQNKQGRAVISNSTLPQHYNTPAEVFDNPERQRSKPAPLVLAPAPVTGAVVGEPVRGLVDVGSRVDVVGYGPGTLRYYGRHAYLPGFRCGVELDEPNGRNNGTVEGYYYFWCSDNFGVLVDVRKVTRPSEEKGSMGVAAPVSPTTNGDSFGGPNGEIGDISVAEGDSKAAQISSIRQQARSADLAFSKIPKRRLDAQYSAGSMWTARNRYADIMPYDDTRVKLSGHEDYINANYVSFASPSDPLNAVCCQGPTPDTTADMWRLVAEQNIEIVVMLTNLVESGRNKCAQYWPAVEGSTEIYGTVQVLWAGTENAGGYVVREFVMTHRGVSRTVYQVHFTDWPDHGIPTSARQFVDMMFAVERIKRKVMSRFSPLLVHCSAGVGRTGVFMMMNIVLDKLRRRIIPDLAAILEEIRKQRMLLVQTDMQFKFCHEAAETFLNSDKFEYL
eukprot:m.1004042 g.1004042  ORF g.1004042 m.1004042 type:complete len:1187 (+) comp24047_c0_seq1:242-3802(+)